jgi:hypothetical protein
MRLLALLLSVLLLPAGPAAAAEIVGAVDRVVGVATATGPGGPVALAAEGPIHFDDLVTTGEAARLQIGFNDGTRLTLGERCTLRIDAFVYQPGSSGGTIALAIAGPFRYVSGAVGGGTKGEGRVVTPVATIGLRGTDFWGGEVDREFGVILLAGSVSVTTAAGTVVLAAPGEGTNVAAPDAPPGPVVIWTPDKVERALATVAFP